MTARLAAKSLRDPDSRYGLAETAGCVTLAPSNLQLISLSTFKNWTLRILYVKNAFLQADACGREVYARAPPGQNPHTPQRIRELRAPAGGLNDAQVAFFLMLNVK